ncbi:MAG: response regulator [Lachnospiraceae bacterium]|nr:response regulator [Lachnospiraceae bacterium]
MNIHDILLVIQYITVVVLFVEILIVFVRWKNPIHSYLFLTCISSFISNAGYLLEMQSGSEEAYLTALKISYIGRVWIVFAFFLFSARMCGVKIPKWITCLLVAVHMGIYATVLTIGKNNLYYREYRFVQDPDFPKFYHENGNMHDLLMGLNVILIFFAMAWVIKAYRKEKNKTSKRRFMMMIMAFGVQSLFFALQVAGVLGISKYYDLTMPGALAGTVLMLIAIFRFDLLGTREIAKDFVIDRISEGIIAVDNEGRIQYFNEPVTKIYPEFGVFFSDNPAAAQKLNDIKEHGISRNYTPYDIVSVISEAAEKGENITVEDRIFTPEESELIYGGEKYGKLYALIDDTEHYHYMKELQKQKDIADSANEAKSRFLASMSHEIRTPINAVLGMDEMILRESGEKNIRAYASDIKSAGRTLLSLINDILDLSKVEEGKMEIIPVQYDLSLLINDLLNMIRERADKKGLKLCVNVDPEIPRYLTGDEIRIRQCAMNLLTNAVKYTEKGEVALEVSHEREDDDHIMLKITVRDTGIGMKEADMENLFSPYKRIEEERNRAIEGTGLGMSITRQLLGLMGSDIAVQSEYGKGSVFSFSIRQETVSEEVIGDFSGEKDVSSGSSYEYRELFHAPDARILVIDDTEMNLTVITSLLKKTQIVIDTAMSGEEGIRLVGRNDYDVIFIDHMMPDMDGIETLEHIRNTDRGSRVPAVALTANAVSGAREKYLKAGFTDYLSKPVDGTRLEKLLHNLIPADKIKVPEDTERTDNKDNSTLPGWIKDVSDLDVRDGIKNCGSESGYLSVLNVFHQTAADKADEIERSFTNEDLEKYSIKVHALKSSARIIGAGELSKLAEELEKAGKSGEVTTVHDKTATLLEMYRALDEKLKKLDPETDDLPVIESEAMKEAYQTIYEIAQSMDYGLMEEMLADLKGYKLSGSDANNVSKIERMLTELDWDGIIQLVSEKMAGKDA